MPDHSTIVERAGPATLVKPMCMFAGVAGEDLDATLKSRFMETCRRHPRAARWQGALQVSDDFVLLADRVEQMVPVAPGGGYGQVVAFSGAAIGSAAPHAPGTAQDVLSVPQKFDGPFVGAAVRTRPSVVMLVRDKLGLRSLFYRVENRRIWFSDDAGLLVMLLGGAQARPYALAEWCHFGASLAPRSMYEGICSIGAGEKVTFYAQTGAVTTETYFRVEDLIDAAHHRELSARSHVELEAEVDKRLERSARSFRQGQDRVGVLLSGGVDSSLLSAVAARHGAVDTLTVQTMTPSSMNELAHAKAVAAHLGVPNQVLEFDAPDFRAEVVDTVFSHGAPVLLENGLAMHRLARDGLIAPGRRMLDGEGADALFAGSVSLFRSDYALLKLASVSFSKPGSWSAIMNKGRAFAGRLGITTWTPWEPYGLHEVLGAGRLGTERIQADIMERYGFIEDPVERRISAFMVGEFYTALRACFFRLEAAGRVAGADVCLPFLTEELMHLGFNLPMQWKLRPKGLLKMPETKWLLKGLAAKNVPPHVVYRPKDGFDVPGAQWLGQWPAGWLADSWLAEHLGLSRDALAWWLKTYHLSRDRFYLTTMEIWGRLFIRAQPLDEVRAQWMAG